MAAVITAWRHLPNALSVARLGSVPLLGYFAASGAEQRFTWLLVPALLTDVADGYIARRFGLTSRLGAMLDSLADALLFLVAVFGVWALHPDVLREHALAGLLLAGSWVTEMAVALVRYGRLSSFHTYASKVAGYLLGIMVGVLFVWGLPPLLLYAAVIVSVGANLEELALMWLLPAWRTDVRGLYWVLRDRRTPPP
ncbi:MAG TPA: CDP-alcohol phosphatidyltransferase family protein [Steroidobacteraceae bacterium]|nr:CDP-alcohol phosphatidyltransferase family protein [Steroidobacteraceae bacterium]